MHSRKEETFTFVCFVTGEVFNIFKGEREGSSREEEIIV